MSSHTKKPNEVFDTWCVNTDVCKFMKIHDILSCMGYRAETIAAGNVYHVYNRGVNRVDVFDDDTDRCRFIDTLVHYVPRKHPGGFALTFRGQRPSKRSAQILASKPARGKGLVDLLCYCLMDNHVHLLLHNNREDGLAVYLQRVFVSYSRYYNTRSVREGPLFTGPYKAVRVTTDEQFLHVTRYIHINPFVAGMVQRADDYRWSSIREYVTPFQPSVCHTTLLRGLMTPEEYRKFVTDYADYAKGLEAIQHLTHD